MKKKGGFELMGNWVIMLILFVIVAVVVLYFSTNILSEIAYRACLWGNQFISFFDQLLGTGVVKMECIGG